VKLFTS